MRTAAASLAVVSVLLNLVATPCSGRTHLRGSATATKTTAEKSEANGGGHLRGSTKTRNKAQPEKRREAKTGKIQLRGGRGGNGHTQHGRNLQASPPTGVEAEPALPECASLFVPTMAGALTGTYTFKGRYNDGRPVYVEPETGNNMFAMSSETGLGGWLGPASWYITQADPTSKFFLSLESNVFELAELEGLQPWVRNNDPSCKGCVSNLRIKCTALTGDDPSAAAASEPEPEQSEVDPVPLESGGSNSTTTAATTAEVTGVDGCANLVITHGADRTGNYAHASESSSSDAVVVRNGRPSYAAAGEVRTDEVFSTMMDVCAQGYGVVDAAWADAVGDLVPTATVHAVFLMYTAANVGFGNFTAAPADCEVPVWLVTSGGVTDLETAGEGTFLAVSDLEDPSEVTSWAKFTPATETERATLEPNPWVQVDCADAAVGGGAIEETALGVPSPPPVGTEPNTRRLRG